jgi:hypothetical protein
MLLPCFPTSTWIEITRTHRLRLVDARTDDDGDIWSLYVVASGYWRSTLTIQNGATTCIVAGHGLIQPERKDNI